MTWNHRVVIKKYKGSVEEQLFEIHECYYDKPADKVPTSCTVNAIDAHGGTLEELREQLAMMLMATYRPVLKYEKIGKKSPRRP